MNVAWEKLFVFIKNRKAPVLCGFIVVFIIFFAGILPSSFAENASAPEAANSQELINQKMEEIKQLHAQISKYQADVKQKQQEGKTLKNQIAIYDGNISKNELEIKETKANIEKTELEIAQAKMKIEEDGKDIEKNKELLKDLIQTLYGYQQNSILEILISKNSFSDFFNEVNSIKSTQDKMSQTVINLKNERESLAVRNVELEANQEDYQNLIEMRLVQNESIEQLRQQKNELLKATKGEESNFQSMLSQNRSLLPSLQAELRSLQSLGESIDFDDAISAAKYVGNTTGVRPALLLAILRVESGLGTNVGGGKYTTDMNPKQRPTFEAITKELGYDPNEMPCSKRPKSYSGWGGAIGPAQMMPTTWVIYRDQVSQITGHYPADPWNLTDSITAIAIKLSQVPGVTAENRDAEYQAAGIYLAGNNWKKFTFYPDKVMYYADLYEKELGG